MCNSRMESGFKIQFEYKNIKYGLGNILHCRVVTQNFFANKNDVVWNQILEKQGGISNDVI